MSDTTKPMAAILPVIQLTDSTMKKIAITTTFKKMLSDVYTPVSIYLRLRDRFRDTILLESADYSAAENSFSFIGINAIGGIEMTDFGSVECKLPGQKPEKVSIKNVQEVPGMIWDFMQHFAAAPVAEKAPEPKIMVVEPVPEPTPAPAVMEAAPAPQPPIAAPIVEEKQQPIIETRPEYLRAPVVSTGNLLPANRYANHH